MENGNRDNFEDNYEDNYEDDFGDELRERREKLGYRQEDVARLIGVAQGTVSNIEHRRYPTYYGRLLSSLYDKLERCRAIELLLKHPDVLNDPRVLAATLRHLLAVLTELLAQHQDEPGGELGPAA